MAPSDAPIELVPWLLRWGVLALVLATTTSAQIQEAWAARYNSPQNGTDVVTAMTVDKAGNTYVTGQSRTNSHLAYATLKHDAQGNQLWVAHYTAEKPSLFMVRVGGCFRVAGYYLGSDGRFHGSRRWSARDRAAKSGHRSGKISRRDIEIQVLRATTSKEPSMPTT
jgi:hypothetical protein